MVFRKHEWNFLRNLANCMLCGDSNLCLPRTVGIVTSDICLLKDARLNAHLWGFESIPPRDFRHSQRRHFASLRMPDRDFNVSSLALSSLLESTTTISPLCINRQLRCCNPAVVIFSLHRRFRRCDFEALAHCSCPDSHFSTYAFWHDSLLPVSRHLLTIDLTRATHCPIIVPVVNTVIILTIDRASSSGRHTRQRHMPVDRQQRHPARYLRRLFSPDFTERRTSKTPSTSPRWAPLHAAHAFIQLRIIACSWAPFSQLPAHRPRPTLVFIRRDCRTFPRTFIRQRY